MASKTRPARSAGAAGDGAASLRAEAERLIDKERYKDAVKQAKLCYKEQATPENHRLLERTYFLRARQLLQQGMRSSAIEVAQHLLDFGVTGSDAPEELVRLLAGLGMEKAALTVQEKLGVAGLKEDVTRIAADQVVLHPDRTAGVSPQLVQEGRLVRQALEALQTGDESGAMGLLRDVPRSSPLSEWRVFVRGLAAFERGDDDEARANWDRLVPDRAPAAIARRMRRLAEEAASGSGSLEAAERRAFGEPVIDRLRQLGTLIAAHDWDKGLSQLGSVRLALHRIDPKLPERLTRVLAGSLIRGVQDMDWHQARKTAERFCRVAQPMAIDPHWNRFWALLWDGPHAEASGAIHYWADYARDLESVDALPPAERDLARALVWNHIAGLHREVVLDLIDDEHGPGAMLGLPPRQPKARRGKESRELASAKKELIDALEAGIKIAPDLIDPYQGLVDAHRDWKDDKGLEAAAERLLAKFPEDIETLRLLANHHYDRKDLIRALSYVERARRLRPLDAGLRRLEWRIRVGLARGHAIAKKWDEARAGLDAADALEPEMRDDLSQLARRAMLEYKAGQDVAGDLHLERAKSRLEEPGPIWLAMMIESVRFKMPRTRTAEYAGLWEAELKKKPRSETAGTMALLLGSILQSDIEYTGRGTHATRLVGYLEKAKGLKFRREDLEHILAFLHELAPKHVRLHEKLVKAGIKQHPDSVLIQMEAADLELPKKMGPSPFGLFRSLGGARRHLEIARNLAEKSDDPKDANLLPIIQQRLSLLEQLDRGMGMFGGFPFGGGMPFGPGPMDFDPFDDFDDEYDEDEDDEPDATFAPPPRRPPTRKKAGRKKNK